MASKHSTIYKFQLRVPDIQVEAETLVEANRLAKDELEYLSSSNDGSEYLANAGLVYIAQYICFHEETKTFEWNSSKSDKNGTWRKVHTVSVSCKQCGKQLSEVEAPDE